MLNLPLFRIFMATCEENERVLGNVVATELLPRPQWSLLPCVAGIHFPWALSHLATCWSHSVQHPSNNAATRGFMVIYYSQFRI